MKAADAGSGAATSAAAISAGAATQRPTRMHPNSHRWIGATYVMLLPPKCLPLLRGRRRQDYRFCRCRQNCGALKTQSEPRREPVAYRLIARARPLHSFPRKRQLEDVAYWVPLARGRTALGEARDL